MQSCNKNNASFQNQTLKERKKNFLKKYVHRLGFLFPWILQHPAPQGYVFFFRDKWILVSRHKIQYSEKKWYPNQYPNPKEVFGI